MNETVLMIALRLAADEAYQSEVIDPEMEDLLIGEDNEYESQEDWIQQRIDYWLGEAAHRSEAASL